MKLPFLAVASLLICMAGAADETPKIFSGLLKKDTPIKGQIGMVLPPAEIDKLVAKVEASARKDKKWFTEYSASIKPGVPLPFDERLGLTKEEYAEYIRLWGMREFKPMDEVMLLLRKGSGDAWTITATGAASMLTTLRYNPKSDQFQSPNGALVRIEDINAEPTSILGAWTGREWKFEEETSLGKIKENFALGKFSDSKYGLIVYRAQELSSAGTRLLDTSLVIRFPLTGTAPAKK